MTWRRSPAAKSTATDKDEKARRRDSAQAAETEPERTLKIAYDIHRNAYANYDEQPGIFARLRQNFADHRRYLATYDELNALSDRELADIGLSRQNVRDVAREAIYGN